MLLIVRHLEDKEAFALLPVALFSYKLGDPPQGFSFATAFSYKHDMLSLITLELQIIDKIQFKAIPENILKAATVGKLHTISASYSVKGTELELSQDEKLIRNFERRRDSGLPADDVYDL